MIINDQIRELAASIQECGADASAADIQTLVTLVHQNAQIAPKTNTDITMPVGTPYPLDADGFARSFDPLTEEAELYSHWQRYGFVVGRSILSPAACEQTVERITSLFNQLGHDQNGVPVLSRGFFDVYHDDSLAQIRQNVRAYLHHAIIWQQADLWASFDRYGMKLPDHAESGALPLHVDQNPNVHPDFKTTQGVLALRDCPLERGTFCAVPASRQQFSLYAGMARNLGEYVELDTSNPLAAELATAAQPIPLRQGDLVTWDSRTTHANTANLSDQTRYVAYVSAGPARENNPELVQLRIEAFTSGVGSNAREALLHASKKPRYADYAALAATRQTEKLNDLGRLLYGLKRYDF